MTTTKELRRMLDERGAKWWASNPLDPDEETRWSFARSDATFTEFEDGLTVMVITGAEWTPEQAVEATLGRGTCHDKGGTDENSQQVFDCDACGCVLSLYDRDGTNTLCTGFIYDRPRYCPACGRKVVGA